MNNAVLMKKKTLRQCSTFAKATELIQHLNMTHLWAFLFHCMLMGLFSLFIIIIIDTSNHSIYHGQASLTQGVR